MSHIIEVRHTVLKRISDKSCKVAEDHIKKYGPANEEQPAEKEQLDGLLAENMVNVAKFAVYANNEDVLNLNKDNMEKVKKESLRTIKNFKRVVEGENPVPADSLIEFCKNQNSQTLDPEVFANSYKNILLAMIDEYQKLVDVIKDMEGGILSVDTAESKTTIQSCLDEMRKFGLTATKEDFIEKVNSNVWEADHRFRYVLNGVLKLTDMIEPNAQTS